MERITAKGIDVWVERPRKVTKMTTASNAEVVQFGDLTPANMQRPDGETLKLITGDGVSIELSKRRSVMPFWHRNMEYDEVIICIKGEAKWLTENGDFALKAGELLLIPKGVSHSASSSPDSEYVAIEVKSRIPISVTKRPNP